jgi:CheY-like chemotaxis protein
VNGAAKGLTAVPTVLVIDDEPQIIELLRSYLERERLDVAQAVDREAALREHERARVGGSEDDRTSSDHSGSGHDDHVDAHRWPSADGHCR